MKFDFEFSCDQLNSTNHSLQLEVSSSASSTIALNHHASAFSTFRPDSKLTETIKSWIN